MHFAQFRHDLHSDLYAYIQNSKKLLTKYFAWFIIRSKYIIIRHLIEVADMISTLLHTTANGGRGKGCSAETVLRLPPQDCWDRV